MRVVFYLRMSTDRQDTSISQQREVLQRHVKKHGYRLVREYVDEGISGDATHKRKAFQKMIADAAAGSFDRIVCFDQDRFGRFDMIEAGRWVMPLRDAGVDLETIAQGLIDWNDFGGRIKYAVEQEAKHGFLRDLSRNSLRGQIDRARQGNGLCGAPAPYGYRRDSTLVGRKTISTLVPDPTEARVVKKIFETYAATGGTLLAVGEMLHREGIPSPSGAAKWHRNAVRRILRNRTYVGDYVWGKTMSGRFHVRVGDEIVERRGATRKAVNEPIVHAGMLPALVNRDLFDRVQDLLSNRRKATRRPGTVRPLSGLIFCGCCGSPMHVNFGDYRCSRSVDFGDGERCTMAIARGEPVLSSIAEELQRHVLAPKALAAIKARLERLAREEQEGAAKSSGKGLAREIASLDKEIADGIARIPLMPKGLVPELAKRLDTLRGQRDELTRRRDASKTRRPASKSAMHNRVADAVAAIYGLRDALTKGDPARVNDALRNVGLRVYFDTPRARVVVDPMNPAEPAKLGQKRMGTRNAPAAERDNSPALSAITFFVPIPVDTTRKGPKPKSRAG